MLQGSCIQLEWMMGLTENANNQSKINPRPGNTMKIYYHHKPLVAVELDAGHAHVDRPPAVAPTLLLVLGGREGLPLGHYQVLARLGRDQVRGGR